MELEARIRVEKDVIVRLHRKLSGKGSILISEGAEVSPTDTLGTSTVSAGFRTLNLTQVLSVSPSEIPRYLKKTLGQKIFKGELLAYKEGGLFGGKVVVVSPTDAVLDYINTQTGEIKLTLLPKKEDLPAGVYGIVETVDPQRGLVIIRIQASLVHGMFGSGRSRDGILHVVGRPDELLGQNFVPLKYHGQILVGGSMVFKEAISACISAGINGLITGGINAKDYKSIAGGRLVFPKKLENDVGISIVVCEGFGSVPIGQDIFELLKSYNFRFASIDGNLGTIILPSFEGKSILAVKKTRLPDRPPEHLMQTMAVEAKKGQSVRIIGPSYTGEQGKIVAIDQTETVIPSGIKTLIATVETQRRKLAVPVANLEIIL